MNRQSNHSDPAAAKTSDRRARVVGIIVTIVFHALVLLGLIWAAMEFVPFDSETHRWPPVKDEELLYGGEYVVLGEPLASAEVAPQPEAESADLTQAEVATPEGADEADAGEALATPAPPVVQKHESPVKVKTPPEKPKPAGPTQAEIEEQQRIKRQQEASRRINDRVSFGGSTATTNKGREGQANGNADHGALSGAPGTDLAGRTLASWSKPSGSATGTITVKVTVNRKGKVMTATYVSGTGAIAANSAARRSCEQAALRSAFSVNDDAPATQTGRITYRFE